MKIDLTGLNILITGGSRGIGAAICSRLGRAGACLAVHYVFNQHRAEQVAGEAGGESRAFQADLSDPAEAGKLFRRASEHFSRIDVVVNNAGIAIQSDMSGDGDRWLNEWNQTLAVNLTSLGMICREAILHFSERSDGSGGRIINIASRAAFRGDTPEYMAYAASKGGVISLTRSIARGFGKDGVKAFALAPGFVRTDMAEDSIQSYGEDYVIKDIALNRLTEPDDIAPLVVLLASGLADHATGTSIDINAASYVR